MGKNKKKKIEKEIQKAFKGWDEITPEDQKRNADEFFNLTEDSAEYLLDIDTSDIREAVDEESGLETTIVNDIINNFKTEETYSDTDEDLDKEFEELESISEPEDDEVPEALQNVLDNLENEITSTNIPEEEVVEETTNDLVAPDKNLILDPTPVQTVVEEETDRFCDVRRFGCVVRKSLGLVNFNDGLSTFTINEHAAMLEGLADNIDTSTFSVGIIELFKKALIINRYPAALYTQDEFVSMLGRGRFTQQDYENAVFVSMLNKYIAVYFVRTQALDRFDSTITEIVPSPFDETSDPRANIWTYLATVLDSDSFSFVNNEDFAELFYNSTHNEKELVSEYLNATYIDQTVDEDTTFDIINRDTVTNKFDYIINEIIDLDDDDEDEEEDIEEEKETEEEPEMSVEGVKDASKEALVEALSRNAGVIKAEPVKPSSDGSMVIPVHHKEGKR